MVSDSKVISSVQDSVYHGDLGSSVLAPTNILCGFTHVNRYMSPWNEQVVRFKWSLGQVDACVGQACGKGCE